jgi:release factor glutamine methyltransferase
MNIGDALQNAAETLKASDVPDPAREARSLLSFVLQRDTAFLIAHPEVELTADRKLLFQSCVRRRAGHEPFQYITGRQEFFGLDFLITPDVLIPRPETEVLVEAAIDILANVEAANICEIGVGSGCISIAILKNVPGAQGVGVDISEAALAVARRNAEMHGVAGRLALQKGDVFDGVSGSFDLIVSNPPYVPAADIGTLQTEVREFEPHLALDGGDDGLDIVRKIIRDSPGHLKPGGTLLMEIGFDQSPKVRDLFDQTLWYEPDFLPDLQGIPRIVKAVLRQTV